MSPTDDTPPPVPASISSLMDVGPSPVFGVGAKKPKRAPQTASFLSGAALPDRSTQGGKTLTGQ